MNFIIEAKDVESLEAAIHHIRDNIQARIYPTEASMNEARNVLAMLLCVMPKEEPCLTSH